MLSCHRRLQVLFASIFMLSGHLWCLSGLCGTCPDTLQSACCPLINAGRSMRGSLPFSLRLFPSPQYLFQRCRIISHEFGCTPSLNAANPNVTKGKEGRGELVKWRPTVRMTTRLHSSLPQLLAGLRNVILSRSSPMALYYFADLQLTGR